MSNGAHPLTDADVAAIRETWDKLITAVSASDWDAAQRHIAADYVNLEPRVKGLMRGSAAWREFVDSMDPTDVDARWIIEELSGRGDLAYVVWTFLGSWTEGGERVETTGKGLTLVRREADGAWRWSHNAWNPDP